MPSDIWLGLCFELSVEIVIRIGDQDKRFTIVVKSIDEEIKLFVRDTSP